MPTKLYILLTALLLLLAACAPDLYGPASRSPTVTPRRP